MESSMVTHHVLTPCTMPYQLLRPHVCEMLAGVSGKVSLNRKYLLAFLTCVWHLIFATPTKLATKKEKKRTSSAHSLNQFSRVLEPLQHSIGISTEQKQTVWNHFRTLEPV